MALSKSVQQMIDRPGGRLASAIRFGASSIDRRV